MTADTLLRMSEVETRTGVHRATIYRWVAAGTFPQPVRVRTVRVAWRERDIVKWQAALTVGVRPAPDPLRRA